MGLGLDDLPVWFYEPHEQPQEKANNDDHGDYDHSFGEVLFDRRQLFAGLLPRLFTVLHCVLHYSIGVQQKLALFVQNPSNVIVSLIDLPIRFQTCKSHIKITKIWALPWNTFAQCS